MHSVQAAQVVSNLASFSMNVSQQSKNIVDFGVEMAMLQRKTQPSKTRHQHLAKELIHVRSSRMKKSQLMRSIVHPIPLWIFDV
ncbi:hypothetical protein A0J61_05202 [Choanephora cucurbitarum]|uniref:Uncharacterized protein n=1 Tax=Choanephora cucurbitarum TaxID=101091 RepID=A0A1C7NCB1_9FUNG|nr:hypothetical protein A0J61_05202 [Choanephora cucurbitarum]